MKKPPHVIEIFLNPGEFYFGDEGTRIRTILGSCVAITMWHPRLRVGGMCHYMLPSRSTSKRTLDQLDGRFSEDAMLMFMREIKKSSTRPLDYDVKMFGGGAMFNSKPCRGFPCNPALPTGCNNVACMNVLIGESLIEQYGFRVKASHLGGEGHRQVVFDLWNGHVWLKHVPKGLG